MRLTLHKPLDARDRIGEVAAQDLLWAVDRSCCRQQQPFRTKEDLGVYRKNGNTGQVNKYHISYGRRLSNEISPSEMPCQGSG